MTIPTRIIEKPEFMELSKGEGDTLMVYKLTNVPFQPPLPNGERHEKVEIKKVNVLLMNVTQPLIYKDKDHNTAYVIMNGYDDEHTMTYENFQDCHIVKNSWGYRLAPAHWSERDETDDLEDAIYVFKHGEEGADWDAV